MAEHVQATLDRMVSDLVLFQKDSPFSTLLSPTELQSIIEQRRTKEYLLRRRNPRCSDFLDYIQYETQLYQLLQLRFNKHMKVESASKSKKSSQKTIRKEYQQKVVRPILQHIHLLYIRTLRRYKHQYALFRQYADFCRQMSSHQRLHACYQDALKYHAHNLQLWYDMVQWEFRNLFAEDATARTPTTISSLRTILQRGIRLHPTAVQLWLYSIQVELQFVKTRFSLTNDDDNAANASSLKNEDDTAQKYYALVLVIYDHAFRSLEKDERRLLQFHTQCVDLLYEYYVPVHTDAIVQHMVDTVAQRGSNRAQRPPSPLWYILRATLAVQRKQQPSSSSLANAGTDASEEDEEDDVVWDILQEACQAIPTSDMIVTALHFLRTHCLRQVDPTKIDRVRSRIDELYKSFRQNETESPVGVASVVYEYIQYLRQDSEDDETDRRALEVVQEFINQSSKHGAIPSYLWIQYAALTYRDSSNDASRCILILQQALQCIPMHQQPDYSNVLEQLFCVYIHCRTSTKSTADTENGEVFVSDDVILKLLDEIVLLSPGRSSLFPNKPGATLKESGPAVHGESNSTSSPVILATIPNLPAACYQYAKRLADQLQQHSTDPQALKRTEHLFRKVCDKVVLESNTMFQWLNDSETVAPDSLADFDTNRSGKNKSNGAVTVQQLLDIVIEAEVDYLRVIRLYDRAIQLFQMHHPSWVQFYQEQKAEIIRYRSADRIATGGMLNKRRKLIATPQDNPDSFDSKDLLNSIPVLDFADATASVDKLTQLYNKYQILHVENSNISSTEFSWKDIGTLYDQLTEADQATFCFERANGVSSDKIQAKTFLSSDSTSTKERAYCSFLLQKSVKLYNATVPKLPFQDFPQSDWIYEPTVWFFFGRNFIGSTNLDGRPEHTDSVSHDGTWHFQLSGSKRWFIRPTSELLHSVQLPYLTTSSEWCVECKEGDILIINTRLWFHRTIIPPQRMPSVSYARDFRFGDATLSGTPCNMTNVDGLYATEDIAKGTVIFTEIDMPDCEIHRSSIDPNCEVVELDDGTSAVMSIRMIKAGEFFSVPESSDEEHSETPDSDSASL